VKGMIAEEQKLQCLRKTSRYLEGL